MGDPSAERIILLTGEKGSGKSTACVEVAGWAQRCGYSVGGLVTMRACDLTGDLAESADPQGRVALELVSGRYFAFGPPSDGSKGLRPGWIPGASAIRKGNKALAASVPCDLLIVDELGPLELLDGKGWMQAFPVLTHRRYRAGLVVCRPRLLATLISRLHILSPRVIEVTVGSRDTVTETIEKEIESIWSNTCLPTRETQ
jgi:nucleoside-triphosphatase THEP1